MGYMDKSHSEWNKAYNFDDRGFVYGKEYLPELRSCFYDFGAEFPTSFSGYSEESGSDFAQFLMEEFCFS